ncbi:MAG: hypothetical protein K0Q75_2109 [Anaerospora sp.]|nr:hypothetical protein [Anaerospora sp.]
MQIEIDKVEESLGLIYGEPGCEGTGMCCDWV